MKKEKNLIPNVGELLRHLIRFDTTNPPGNEIACATFLRDLLENAGLETALYAKDPQRPNLVARLRGRGDVAPLLLQGHMDVVTTKGQSWKIPPFEGHMIDDVIWGRGTLDMKGALAMMVYALLKAQADNVSLPGDVVFCALSDEEHGGVYGAKYLVEEHPGLFKGIRYGLGEFGGFPLVIGGQRFYPIMVAEKQLCWMEMILHGPGGHGANTLRDGAMSNLAKILIKLNHHRLPVHITPITRTMIETIAAHLSIPTRWALDSLLQPWLTDLTLDRMGEYGRMFDSLLHNTVNATIVRGGDKINVIPSEVSLALDGRLLPGFTSQHLTDELHNLLECDFDLKMLHYDPTEPNLDMGMFSFLGDTLRSFDPQAIPLPLLLSAVTDGRFFARLGIQTYGFTPMDLPPNFNFYRLIHAADERVPLSALEFGMQAIYHVLQKRTL